MLSAFSKPAQLGFAVSALVSAWGLTGCGAMVSPADQSYALPGRTITGNVHGGVFPIQNATIRLMETQSNGYGGAAKQLQQTSSDSNGYFTFSDTNWSCDAAQYVYITVTAGHTSTYTANYNVAQIGIVGNCGQVLGNVSAFDKVQVFVSELSTIAAAYTLRGFITVDDTNAATGQQIINISAPANNNATTGACTSTTPVTCVAAGLAHGFQNAYNLVDSVNYNDVLPSGQARSVPPSNTSGAAVVPQAEINTLANILQSCVDSAGGTVGTYSTYSAGSTGSTRCGDLFYYATPPGSTTPPTNTLEAALNMAQYPANNATNLFNLQPRAVFFTPDLNTAPHDLSLSIVYVTNYIGAGLPVPVGLALDSNDDAIVLAASATGTSNTKTGVLGLASNGAGLFAGTPSTTYLAPKNIAVDALNNIWFTNDSASNGAVLKASSSTGAISVGTTLASAAGLAVDKFNNVWVSLDSTSANSVQKFTNASLSGSATPALKSNVLGAGLLNLTLDGSSNVWSLNSSGTASAAVVYANTGTSSAPAYANNLSSQAMNTSAGVGMAANSAGEVYFPLNGQINDAMYSSSLSVNNLGTFSGSSQDNASYAVPNMSEVDGAGNLFFSDYESAGHLFEFIPPSGGGAISGGRLYSITTCYVYGTACLYNAIPYERSLQIDSSGATWYLADVNINGTAYGAIIQTFGPGVPTWPLLASQKPGVKPQ